MVAEVTPPLPARQDVEASVQVIHDNAERLFLWDYERDRGQLVTLYNKAMGSQWNSVKDLDWSIDVDPERLVAEGWVEGPAADKGDRWDPAELGKIVPDLVAKAAPNANMGGRRK